MPGRAEQAAALVRLALDEEGLTKSKVASNGNDGQGGIVILPPRCPSQRQERLVRPVNSEEQGFQGCRRLPAARLSVWAATQVCVSLFCLLRFCRDFFRLQGIRPRSDGPSSRAVGS